jgi:hypothetical protein
LLSFSQDTPLHYSAARGRLEVTRLLVESKADVAARDMCFSPPPSHHLSLTIGLAAVAGLHSNGPSAAKKPTSLHTCAASALLNDAPPRAAAAQIKSVLLGVAAAVRQPAVCVRAHLLQVFAVDCRNVSSCPVAASTLGVPLVLQPIVPMSPVSRHHQRSLTHAISPATMVTRTFEDGEKVDDNYCDYDGSGSLHSGRK